jgi:hypothetical protein
MKIKALSYFSLRRKSSKKFAAWWADFLIQGIVFQIQLNPTSWILGLFLERRLVHVRVQRTYNAREAIPIDP